MASRTRCESEGSDNSSWTCVVCCQRVPGTNRRSIYAIGVCEHVVCYECSTKLRVLCKQNECPICRQDLQKVIFTCDRRDKFSDEEVGKCIYNNEYKIYFQNEVALEAYGKLLENKCYLCKLVLKDLADLEKHLQKEHNLFLCELCVEHLKVFSYERKYYTRRDLIRHKKCGDVDDRSHRGHPKCSFCETRFFDEEFLLRHRRSEHYYCHICDPGGVNKFFGTYTTLREHFKTRHFLCEEGSCAEEKFTTVFKSEIDFQAHKAKTHCHSKSESKSARTLALDLLIKPQRHRSQASAKAALQKKDQKGSANGNVESEDDHLQSQPAAPQALPQPEDFPELTMFKDSLHDSSAAFPVKKSFSARVGGAMGPLSSRNDEEFPALCSSVVGNNAPKATSSSKRSMSSIAAAFGVKNQTSKSAAIPFHTPQKEMFSTVNVINCCDHNPNTATTRSKEFAVQIEDFPALPAKQGKSKGRRKKKNVTNGNIEEKSSTHSKEREENGTECVVNSVEKPFLFDDFPSLTSLSESSDASRQNTAKRPPPGLKKVVEGGLLFPSTSYNQPPPGYSKDSRSQRASSEMSLTTVAQQVMSKPKAGEPENNGNCVRNFQYIQPPDFSERNKALVQEVSSLLNEKFDFFKMISKEFREGDINGEDYWKKCLNLFGKNNLSKVFSELLVLLPDIRKQNELFSLYENYQKSVKGAIPKRSHSSDGVCHSVDFTVCPTCRQILAKKDSGYHFRQH